ncbi:MAG: Stf0 family sulfotransferase [Anaerolineales bacterium]
MDEAHPIPDPIKPRTAYVVCGVQRSGSSLLCEALKNTGLAGRPEEFFLDTEGWEEGEWARRHGVTSRREFLRLVFREGTAPNGVFGVKIMWNYFHTMLGRFRQLPEYEGMEAVPLMTALFPGKRYIWIIRRDKIRQAVSWARAGQTQIYARRKGDIPVPKGESIFDFSLIDNLHRLILEGEAGWSTFFRDCGVCPFQVAYEDLAGAYERTALDILDFLDVAHPANPVFGERLLQKQADALNDDWVEKYRAIKDRTSPGAP